MYETVKIVLAGCGSMSEVWIKSVQSIPNTRIVGMVDIKSENASAKAKAFNLENVVIDTNLANVLDRTKPDVVFDCSIPDAHTEVTLQALNHGCHVLGEKPMASSMKNAQAMVQAAKEKGLVYAVIQNYRYNSNIRKIRQFIKSPDGIGPITTINADFYIGAHFGGFRDIMQHVLLLDMAIHTFDAARFLTGADPVSVYCREWNPKGSWYAHGASAMAVFEMSNGEIFNYRGSWCAEGLATSWNSEWRIIGQKGSLQWNGNDQIQAQTILKQDGFLSTFKDHTLPEYDNPEKIAGHESIIREFLHCIQNRQIPETVCTDNIKSLAMVFGAIQSAETGKPVDLKSLF